ncbi:hypothetical protein BTR25_08440 [Bacillus sp. MRMR6]|nr:hypothetical protein BTR25_08440 [Bacillus sp. MRMR6]
MFFLLLTGMLIAFVVGTTFLVKGEMLFGSIGVVIGILLLLYILFAYGRKKYRKRKKWDFDCFPDCPNFDSDCKPDCDCGPNCD